VWSEVKNLIDFEMLEQSVKVISLEELIEVYPKMLKGETSGRYIVDVNK
jgi:acrylyl-CoA reductase (NADPH)